MNLLKHVDIIRCTSGTHNLADPDNTTHVGPAVDMKGYEGALCVYLGSSKFAQGTTAPTGKIFIGATTAALIAATGTITVTAATSSTFNRKCVVMDVYKPTKRYIQPRMTVYWASTGNDNVQWLILKYGSRYPGSTSMMASTGINAGSGIILSPTT